jgi:hypothetical protein
MTARQHETLQPEADRGTWSAPVSWDEADDLHRELKKRGHPFTLCLSVATRTACLEPWPGVDPQSALAALRDLLDGGSGGIHPGNPGARSAPSRLSGTAVASDVP